MSTPAIFLDKDGTIIENVPYNVNTDRIRFYPDVEAGLRCLAALGFHFVVVTNQPGVARGFIRASDMDRVCDFLQRKFAEFSVRLSGCYYCPHHPEGRVKRYSKICGCRKPQGGLILMAAKKLDIDLKWSWFIGDILDDVEAGRRCGCRTVLIDRGHETLWEGGEWRQPDAVVKSFKDAAEFIAWEHEHGPALAKGKKHPVCPA